MSINLTKNQDALVEAWRSVVDDKSSVNWAVYSYEGQTNNLKVVSTGSNGLEEMIEELNSGLIMYAFCRVIDKKTSLPKCLLINWQGEGVPIVRKGTCANHIRDIERLLKGAHITISARCEEDVEVDLIMDKLSRATASSYKFNEPRTIQNGAPPVSVGTVYKRVNPEFEINVSERDRFWQKEEKEEKLRQEQERQRAEERKRKLEEEARKRDEIESQKKNIQVKKEEIQKSPVVSETRTELKNLREQNTFNSKNIEIDVTKVRSDELRKERNKEAQELIAQRTIDAKAVFKQNIVANETESFMNHHTKRNNIDAVKKTFEQNIFKNNESSRFAEKKSLNNIEKEDISKVRSEELRKERNKEAQELIAQRTINARAVFEQNTVASGTDIFTMHHIKKNNIDTVRKAFEQSILKENETIHPMEKESPRKIENHHPVENNHIITPHLESVSEIKTDQIINNSMPQNNISVKNENSTNVNSNVENIEVLHIDETSEIKNGHDENLQASDIQTNGIENETYEQSDTTQYLYLDPNNRGMTARALYDYQAADETEITFDPGDLITHIDAIDEGWWQGLAPDGTYGLFPANHVEVVEYGST